MNFEEEFPSYVKQREQAFKRLVKLNRMPIVDRELIMSKTCIDKERTKDIIERRMKANSMEYGLTKCREKNYILSCMIKELGLDK